MFYLFVNSMIHVMASLNGASLNLIYPDNPAMTREAVVRKTDVRAFDSDVFEVSAVTGNRVIRGNTQINIKDDGTYSQTDRKIYGDRKQTPKIATMLHSDSENHTMCLIPLSNPNFELFTTCNISVANPTSAAKSVIYEKNGMSRKVIFEMSAPVLAAEISSRLHGSGQDISMLVALSAKVVYVRTPL